MASEKSTGVNILVEVAPVAIPVSAGVALTVPDDAVFKTLIGRSTGYSISGERFDFDAEFGDVNVDWDSGSTITSRGWTSDLDFYFKNNDEGHQIVEDAVFKKNEAGVPRSPYIYLRIYPLGKLNNAKYVHGFATVDSLDNTYDRAGALEGSYSFTGEGELFRGRYVVAVPTYTSKTPATGAPGTAITYTGTNMNSVGSVQYRQGATLAGVQNTLTTRSATNFTANVPAGLAAGSYNVFMMYPGGEVAAGTHTVS